MPEKKSAIKKERIDPKTGKKIVTIRKKKKPEAKAPAKAPAKSTKAAFVKREIAKGNLKKEGGKIVEAKAPVQGPRNLVKGFGIKRMPKAPLPSNAEVFKMKDKLIELAMEEEELIDTDGATEEYLKTLRKMEETTPIYKHQQPRLMLAKAINPKAKSTSKTLLKLYQEARKKGVIKGEVLQKWNEWKRAIAEGAKLMRLDEIGLVPS